MLSRSDSEALFEASTSGHTGLLDEIKDIHEAQAIQSLRDIDGNPFLSSPPEELRLVFSLCVDGFNAFGKKVGGPPASVTGIYLALLSLPIDKRFNPENMCLIRVIPGPHKPSEDEINHFLDLLVDDLLQFWEGVKYSRTHCYPSGRTVKAVLVPLVCDVLAARQTGGFVSHNATLFCSLCYLPADRIKDFDEETWPCRTVEEHRKHAMAWRHAPTLEEKQQLAKEFGLRYSALLRLPYWDPVHFTIVDSMHALFLRVLPEHIRRAWGVSNNTPCGEGHFSPYFKVPNQPPDESMVEGFEKLLDAFKKVNPEKSLSTMKHANLWHMCLEFNLCRSGTSIMLARALVSWVCHVTLAESNS